MAKTLVNKHGRTACSIDDINDVSTWKGKNGIAVPRRERAETEYSKTSLTTFLMNRGASSIFFSSKQRIEEVESSLQLLPKIFLNTLRNYQTPKLKRQIVIVIYCTFNYMYLH